MGRGEDLQATPELLMELWKKIKKENKSISLDTHLTKIQQYISSRTGIGLEDPRGQNIMSLALALRVLALALALALASRVLTLATCT
jgi:hypothetical protein